MVSYQMRLAMDIVKCMTGGAVVRRLASMVIPAYSSTILIVVEGYKLAGLCALNPPFEMTLPPFGSSFTT